MSRLIEMECPDCLGSGYDGCGKCNCNGTGKLFVEAPDYDVIEKLKELKEKYPEEFI